MLGDVNNLSIDFSNLFSSFPTAVFYLKITLPPPKITLPPSKITLPPPKITLPPPKTAKHL
jgi:hypothetical protein